MLAIERKWIFMLFFINNENKKKHLCVERSYNIGDEITIVETMNWFEDKKYRIV